MFINELSAQTGTVTSLICSKMTNKRRQAFLTNRQFSFYKILNYPVGLFKTFFIGLNFESLLFKDNISFFILKRFSQNFALEFVLLIFLYVLLLPTSLLNQNCI